ncbi:MAG: hypothetical protein IPH59_02930 [bacterium]|nr:hypothetical protein [bacterium]
MNIAKLLDPLLPSYSCNLRRLCCFSNSRDFALDGLTEFWVGWRGDFVVFEYLVEFVVGVEWEFWVLFDVLD